MPDFPVLHHLPDLAETHVHRVGDAIQLSRPLSSPYIYNYKYIDIENMHVFVCLNKVESNLKSFIP